MSKSWIGFVVAFGLLGAAAAWFVTAITPGRVVHAFVIFFSVPPVETASLQDVYFATQLSGELSRRSAELLRAPAVVAEVYRRADVAAIRPRPFAYEAGWDVQIVGGSVAVRAISTDPGAGEALARATAALLAERIAAGAPVSVRPGAASTTPAPRRLFRNALFGFAAGAVVAIAGFLLLGRRSADAP